MAAISASRLAPPGPGTTRAIPLAKLTSAACTPGCRDSVRCTRAAQEPQVMPCTVKSSAGRAGAASAAGDVPVASVSLTAGDHIALLLDRGVQRGAGDHGLVVAHPDLPCRHVDVGGEHAGQRAQRALDRVLARIAGDLRDEDSHLGHDAAPGGSGITSTVSAPGIAAGRNT